jgi:hypothetical protein
MDDNAPTETPPADFNKLDLTQLQGFSFGTSWTQDKATPGGGRPPREPRSGDRPFRPREGGGERAGDGPRDRRGFRKPAGSDAPAGGGGHHFTARADAPRPDGGSRPPRGGDERGGFRGPRREGGEFRRGGFREDGPRRFGGRDEALDRGPYLSPFFSVTCYPEETSFATLVKTIRTSLRTFELFDIARAVVGKSDRCIAVVQRLPAGGPAAAATDAKPAPFAVSVPDAMPFDTEEAAIAHVMSTHLAQFFDTAEVEVEAPKGNFQVVNKCGVTGELLGPPNYHRYGAIMRQHHATRVRLPFEAFAAQIQTVRDPEAVNQWIEKMKKTVRYTWKLAGEGETAPAFDSLDEARAYLLAHARDQVVRLVESWRVAGKTIPALPPGEIRRAIEGALERQRRFPLDTANALRGRLRREALAIFKKGSKGITYVCAVRRKYRTTDQVFADSLGALIAFIEAHPMGRRSELPEKFLDLKLPEAAKTDAPASTETSAAPAETASAPDATASAPTPAEAAPAAESAATLSPEDRERLTKMNADLRWLISEGYVMEFMDGRLFIPPPVAAAKKHEAESAEDDPENFPDTPAAPASEQLAETPPVEQETTASVPTPATTPEVSGAVE